jgi:hypothetical protein
MIAATETASSTSINRPATLVSRKALKLASNNPPKIVIPAYRESLVFSAK